MNKDKFTAVTIDRPTYTRMTVLANRLNTSNSGLVRDLVNKLWDDSINTMLKTDQGRKALTLAQEIDMPSRSFDNISNIIFKMDAEQDIKSLDVLMSALSMMKQKGTKLSLGSVLKDAVTTTAFLTGYMAGKVYKGASDAVDESESNASRQNGEA